MADAQSYIPYVSEVSERLSALQGISPRTLMDQACELRRQGHGKLFSFSPKVFIPVTRLCRDTCGYCTFAKSPRAVASPFMSPDEILDVARRGAAAGCTEALFTLGDRPEQRYRVAQDALAALGHGTTIGYLDEMARLVHREVGLLVHLNAGILTADEVARMRCVTVSQGLMLESTSMRLCQKGGPHYGCASKLPAARIAAIEAAGQQAVPFTTGILIGIGETRRERVESLLTIRNLHKRFGHIQEVIVQNFLAKPGQRWLAPRSRLSRNYCGRSRQPGTCSVRTRISRHRRINLRAVCGSSWSRDPRLGRDLAGDARLRQSGSGLARNPRIARGN